MPLEPKFGERDEGCSKTPYHIIEIYKPWLEICLSCLESKSLSISSVNRGDCQDLDRSPELAIIYDHIPFN